ncbi:MAG: ISLre2 family transposase [Emergencia sp.]|nr:ISLre2 family transposase [Emergencia sp.]
MDNIIQQIALELAEKIMKMAFKSKLSNIDSLACEVLAECKAAARSILEEVVRELNQQIRDDKAGRKELGLSLKEKDRKRSLLTELGVLNLKRDYYHDSQNGCYACPLDDALGIAKYERIGGSISAKLVTEATEVSYAKSARIVTDGAVSRQSVRNHILKLSVPEKEPDWSEKKEVSKLHVYADEDHVHMQKPEKARGKKGKQVPLVTVTEGNEAVGKRNRTINPMHFVDAHFDGKELWNTVEGYIEKAYDAEGIEKIYVHGDGGSWIRNGLNDFAQTEHVLDGFHLEKYLKQICAQFPQKNLGTRFHKAFEGNDRKKADAMLQKLYAEAEGDSKLTKAVKKFGSYILNNWDEIVRRRTLEIPGSCTEGQVSHVLSERFSRDPIGWSEEGLGKLSQARVYIKNGGKLKGEDFKAQDEDGAARKERYSEYAERMMKEAVEECFDWSIFEKPIVPFNGASGTQTLLHGLGRTTNTLFC